MTKPRRHTLTRLFLIIAFMAVQWSSAHIHLAQHHEHDGSLHEHAMAIHDHYVGNHHADTIDTAHDSLHSPGTLKTVELDQEYHTYRAKDFEKSLVAALPAYPFIWSLALVNTSVPQASAAKLNYLDYTTIRLRAPPQQSALPV